MENIRVPRLRLNIVTYIGFGPKSTSIVNAARTLASLLSSSPVQAEVTVVRLPFADDELEQFDLPAVRIEFSGDSLEPRRAYEEAAYTLLAYDSLPPVVEA